MRVLFIEKSILILKFGKNDACVKNIGENYLPFGYVLPYFCCFFSSFWTALAFPLTYLAGGCDLGGIIR